VRICFVALNSYDLLVRRPIPRHCGGAERQQELLARSLVDRGHQVSFVCWNFGQSDREKIDGIVVYRTRERDAGLPGLRFWGRWTDLCRALHRADADVYYQQCADELTGQVGLWARAHRRRFVFAAASNADCDPALPNLRTWRERVLYRRGLRLANAHICQTRWQREQFLRHFGICSEVIPSIGPNPRRSERGALDRHGGCMWVGRVAPVKRFEWLIELAGRVPEQVFHAVGASNQESAYADALVPRARGLSNIRVHGRVGRSALDAMYSECRALICTSRWEGFPTTFLEAWSHGVPVVSTVDPDGVIARHGLGAVAVDVSGLAAALRALLGDTERWAAASCNARRYYLENHAVERVLPRFESLFADLGRRGAYAVASPRVD